MYIKIGRDEVVKSKDLIAVLDHQSIEGSGITKEFVEASTDFLIHKEMESYKSIVITTDKVYFSTLSSATLLQRSNKSLEK